MKKLAWIVIAAVLVAGLYVSLRTPSDSSAQSGSGAQSLPMPSGRAPIYGYKVINTFPHDRDAFTQGLQFLDGQFFEGTGLNGKSSIRRVEVATGHVEQRATVPQQYFGEGITVLGDKLYELTWQSGTAIVYDKASFAVKNNFPYSGEGWGLTTDGKQLIMSDGTPYLRFIDPETFEEKRRVVVVDDGAPIKDLNELEYIKGEVWANVWQTDRIARIDPETGKVKAWLDMAGVLPVVDMAGTDVLNGIAYDAAGDRIFITGKLWPKLFEIQVGAMK